MAQFDVYINENTLTNSLFPYLLDIQNDLHNSLYSMSTMDMVAVSVSILNKQVCNLSEYRSEIIDAIDFLINGF